MTHMLTHHIQTQQNKSKLHFNHQNKHE